MSKCGRDDCKERAFHPKPQAGSAQPQVPWLIGTESSTADLQIPHSGGGSSRRCQQQCSKKERCVSTMLPAENREVRFQDLSTRAKPGLHDRKELEGKPAQNEFERFNFFKKKNSECVCTCHCAQVEIRGQHHGMGSMGPIQVTWSAWRVHWSPPQRWDLLRRDLNRDLSRGANR